MLTIIITFILGFLAGLFLMKMKLAIMVWRVEEQSKQVERLQKDVRKQLEEAKALVDIKKELKKIMTEKSADKRGINRNG